MFIFLNEILGRAFVKKNIPRALYRRFDPYVFTFNLETETVSKLITFQFQFFIVLHHLHHVTTDTLQYIRTIIIPNKRTLHNEKKRKMCAVTKVA